MFWDWLREEPDHQMVVVDMGTETEPIRQKILFTGQVQGVGFRYVLKEAADVFELTGEAFNNADGTVTAELQGRPLSIENAIHYVQLLSPYILVDQIDQETIPMQNGEHGFVTG